MVPQAQSYGNRGFSARFLTAGPAGRFSGPGNIQARGTPARKNILAEWGNKKPEVRVYADG